MQRLYSTTARLLQTARPLVTLSNVQLYGLSGASINRDYYVWQTNDLNVAQNETISPQGVTRFCRGMDHVSQARRSTQ